MVLAPLSTARRGAELPPGQVTDHTQLVVQERVTRINHAVAGAYGVSGVKAAMNLAGLKGGIPRRPLLPLTPPQAEEMRKALAAEGLLS